MIIFFCSRLALKINGSLNLHGMCHSSYEPVLHVAANDGMDFLIELTAPPFSMASFRDHHFLVFVVKPVHNKLHIFRIPFWDLHFAISELLNTIEF